MTIIAYKNGIIAYDSRITSNSLIESDKHNKMQIHNNCRFFFSGARCDEERFIDAWFGNHSVTLTTHAFVLDDNNVLYRCGVDCDGFWKEPVIMNRHKAIGSGSNFATAAMDFGKSAKESVKYAMTRDSSCGGVIRTYKI